MAKSKKESSKNDATKLTKRAKIIEEKLKHKSATSLFDTDGDLSRHNIIEGGRRSRKRTCSSSSETTKSKSTKRNKTTTIVSKPLIKNAQSKLTPKSKTPVQQVRNEWILERQTKMQEIKAHHDASVKELYHLEMFQNMLEYNPTTFINDVRYNKVKKNIHVNTRSSPPSSERYFLLTYYQLVSRRI
jgi:helicase SWR1